MSATIAPFNYPWSKLILNAISPADKTCFSSSPFSLRAMTTLHTQNGPLTNLSDPECSFFSLIDRCKAYVKANYNALFLQHVFVCRKPTIVLHNAQSPFMAVPHSPIFITP